MKRRSFLKVLGVGVGYLMMPEMALQEYSVGIKNCADLTSAMESMFNCKMGTESAFMELTNARAFTFLGPAAYHYAFDSVGLDKTNPESILRLSYQTFSYAIEGGSSEEAELKLANHFYNNFKKLDENDRKMLAWRLKPVFQSDEVTRFGETWMTLEEIEDRADLNLEFKKVKRGDYDEKNGQPYQWAFKVPRSKEETPPIMVPEGVEYDWDTHSLKYVTAKVMLHKMRMRFVMPEMTFEVANLIKPEGMPVAVLEEKS